MYSSSGYVNRKKISGADDGRVFASEPPKKSTRWPRNTPIPVLGLMYISMPYVNQKKNGGADGGADDGQVK